MRRPGINHLAPPFFRQTATMKTNGIESAERRKSERNGYFGGRLSERNSRTRVTRRFSEKSSSSLKFFAASQKRTTLVSQKREVETGNRSRSRPRPGW